MFTTLHFWAGFVAGGIALAVLVGGTLFLFTWLARSNDSEDEDE
ncbi:MAG: hypothetical protein AAB368_11170 [bacterium]